MSDTALLQGTNLSKGYSGVQALSNVTIEIQSGEIHGLVGENGAGKSTLIKILGGFVRPDTGDVRVFGRSVKLAQVKAAELEGIVVVHQESTAFPDLSAEDNLFLGREPLICGTFLDKRKIRDMTRELLDRIGANVPLGIPLSEVSLAQRQLVAIARALSLKAKLLILDEPTASLSHRESHRLHGIVHDLKELGTSVLYVSHRLEDVCSMADRTTILRDGRLVTTLSKTETTKDRLIDAMVGSSFELKVREIPAPEQDAPIALEVRNLTLKRSFRDVSFSVRKGEIVGLGGLVGAGRTEVARTIFGLETAESGEVFIDGQLAVSRTPASAVRQGIALVPEDRQHQGLVIEEQVQTNLVMSCRSKLAKFGFIQKAAETSVVDTQIQTLAIKTSDPRQRVGSLSGGNQQKVVFGKWLATNPRVLILDEPTRGVDVAAKAEIHNHVRQLAMSGAAVLLISSDLPELLSLSDRIYVMKEGTVMGQLPGGLLSERKVLEMAFGEAKAATS